MAFISFYSVIIMTLLSVGTQLHAGTGNEEIILTLQEINALNPQTLGDPAYATCGDPANEYVTVEGDSVFEAVHFLKREKPISVDCPLKALSFCSAIEKTCNQLHSTDHHLYNASDEVKDNPLRHNGVDDYYPVGTCFDKKNSSWNDHQRALILKQAAQMFYALTQDHGEESLGHICCGDDLTATQKKICLENFNGTRFVVVDDSKQFIGESDNDSQGEFVKASRAKLEDCTDEECIERFFLHELGHTCNRSRKIARDGDDHIYNYIFCQTEGNGESEYSYLPTKMSACLKEHLNFYSDQARSNLDFPCEGSWKIEAFANAIFINKRNSFAHFAWDCAANQDKNHPQTLVYLQCLLDDPTVKHNFCPGNKAPAESPR